MDISLDYDVLDGSLTKERLQQMMERAKEELRKLEAKETVEKRVEDANLRTAKTS